MWSWHEAGGSDHFDPHRNPPARAPAAKRTVRSPILRRTQLACSYRTTSKASMPLPPHCPFPVPAFAAAQTPLHWASPCPLCPHPPSPKARVLAEGAATHEQDMCTSDRPWHCVHTVWVHSSCGTYLQKELPSYHWILLTEWGTARTRERGITRALGGSRCMPRYHHEHSNQVSHTVRLADEQFGCRIRRTDLVQQRCCRNWFTGGTGTLFFVSDSLRRVPSLSRGPGQRPQ